ncbi:MAG: hypothetical protein FWC91_12105 [Defluviitaleaceae bacterium]|nr:hypothetical protein [Defluviitaleaceae bacterium]
MARMTCICGEILSTTAVPNDVELWIYTKKEWDSILENDSIETWKIPLPIYDAWRCLKCERVYIFEPNNNKAIKVYKPEE